MQPIEYMIVSLEIPKESLPSTDDNDDGDSGKGGVSEFKLTL